VAGEAELEAGARGREAVQVVGGGGAVGGRAAGRVEAAQVEGAGGAQLEVELAEGAHDGHVLGREDELAGAGRRAGQRLAARGSQVGGARLGVGARGYEQEKEYCEIHCDWVEKKLCRK